MSKEPPRPSSSPEVVVVVPARNAQATIGRTMAALGRQTFRGGWELVVADDGSTDATAQIAEGAGARVVRGSGQAGPAGARNMGVEASDAPLVAFTDADCEPEPGWLAAVVTGFAQGDLVLGPVRPDPRAPRTTFARTLSLEARSPRFETANLAVRREFYDRVGGFRPFAPESGGKPGLRPRVDQGHFGEDAVFGWRVVRAGGRVHFTEAAVVHHAVFPRGPRGYIAERWRLRFFPALLREAPEMAREMPLGVFLSPRTARFDAAVAGVIATALVRRPLPLLAAAPYIRRCLRTQQAWRRSVARENLALVSADALGLVALVRGSVAARRLLL